MAAVPSADMLAVLQPIWMGKAKTARRVRRWLGTVIK
jgi:hypothetical protein